MTMMTPSPGDQVLPVLTFSLAGQRYALLITDVVEVVAMVELMTLKDAHPEILGMINRHGTVLPMLDLRLIMGHDARSVTTSTLFIVVEHGSRQFGLVVDEVHQVEYVDSNQMQTATKAGKFIRGIIGYKSELMQIIDPAPLLVNYLPDEVDR